MFDAERCSTFLWLCHERYAIKLRKDAGNPRPWTDDPVLHKYHFCNVFRKDDKTSKVIHDLMRQHRNSLENMLQIAILGRMVNRHSTIEGAWCVRNDAPWELADFLRINGVNTNAYRQNTPRGLNSIDGIAELALSETRAWMRDIEYAVSLKEAHALITRHTQIGNFVAYQIALDLRDCDFWVDGFDDSWVLAGPGAVRGIDYLRGMVLDYNWKNPAFKMNVSGKTAGDRFQAEAQPAMEEATRMVKTHWPLEWPTFTIHETEFMLCELDKWIRKSQTAKPSGRIYKC